MAAGRVAASLLGAPDVTPQKNPGPRPRHGHRGTEVVPLGYAYSVFLVVKSGSNFVANLNAAHIRATWCSGGGE